MIFGVDFSDSAAWAAFFQVMVADLILVGDNAIVVGMAANGLPQHLRARAIVLGIGLATVLRILFSLIAFKLLAVVGLTLAGGILLLWVAWKMWRELRGRHDAAADGGKPPAKTLSAALVQIAVADVSMSLDNVLAVAGASRQFPLVLIAGLVISVALSGVASTLIAGLLARHRWIAYIGLVMILAIAVRMVWDGTHEVLPHVLPT